MKPRDLAAVAIFCGFVALCVLLFVRCAGGDVSVVWPWARSVSERRAFVASLAGDLHGFLVRWREARLPRHMFMRRPWDRT